MIAKVKSKIFLLGLEGHPDQIPYILVWQGLVENPPPWLAPFLSSGMCKVLVMQPAGPPKSRTPAAPLYPILPKSQDLLSLDPPPYHPPPLVPQALPTAVAPLVAPPRGTGRTGSGSRAGTRRTGGYSCTGPH